MLTESEKRWLEKREQWAEPHNGYGDEGYFCAHCQINCFDGCPTEIKDGNIDAFMEALEFSERVAAELAGMMLKPNRYPCRGGFPPLGCMRDWSNLTGPMAVHCEDCILREVRLQVEEEMDDE